MLIATEGTGLSIQMTAPLALCIPIILCVIASFDYSSNFFKVMKKINIILLIFVLYGSVKMVQIDQNALSEGRKATVTIAQLILDDIKEEGYLDFNYAYCFLGRPADNRLFKVSSNFYKANQYAKFGEWWTKLDCNRDSWKGIYHNLLGVNLNIQAVISNNSSVDMPCFPKEGYIIENNGIVFIKVSDIN